MSHRRLIPLEKHTCLGCDKLFIPTRTNQYYCPGDMTCKNKTRKQRRRDESEVSHEQRHWNSVVEGVAMPREEKMKSLAWELL